MFDEGRSTQNRSEHRYGSSTDEKKWNSASREPKGVMKVSDSLKLKMMQQSAREDSDGGAGKSTADYNVRLFAVPRYVLETFLTAICFQ